MLLNWPIDISEYAKVQNDRNFLGFVDRSEITTTAAAAPSAVHQTVKR